MSPGGFHFGIERIFEHYHFPHMDAVELPVEKRVLLLCMDAEHIATERLQHFAWRLMDMGAVYFCCFGGDSKRMHDAVDHERAVSWNERAIKAGREYPPLIMTTWHEGDPLYDTVEFWCRYGYPRDEDWGLVRTMTSIVVNHPDWHEQIQSQLAIRTPTDIERGILPERRKGTVADD